MRNCLYLCECLMIALLCGCSKNLSSQYGISEGSYARQSPAAVSVFRNLCDEQGKRSMEVRTFSPRAKTKFATIVWTPDSLETHSSETLKWIEEWLLLGDRTLVYVGRDFSPMADYWSQVFDKLSRSEENLTERLAVKEQLGVEESELDKMRSLQRAQIATPWYISDHSQADFEQVNTLNGEWSQGVDVNKTRIFVRSVPVAYKKSSLTKQQAIFDKKEKDTSATPQDVLEFGFKWQTSDEKMLETVNQLQKDDLPEMELLLSSGAGKPLVSQITRKSWGTSRIVLLTNASLISNISLVNEGNLSIAKKLVATLPNKQVAYLSGAFDPRIRKDESSEQQKGFEMLTIWPLSVISIHTLFLGMLMLLAVSPIFGRSRRLPQKSTRDFGQHVDAMGGLLYKSQDRFYALATIADYFRNVRKEPTSPWANVDQAVQQEPKSPFAP